MSLTLQRSGSPGRNFSAASIFTSELQRNSHHPGKADYSICEHPYSSPKEIAIWSSSGRRDDETKSGDRAAPVLPVPANSAFGVPESDSTKARVRAGMPTGLKSPFLWAPVLGIILM